MAIWPSRLSASSASRSCGIGRSSSSSRPNVTVSPNTDAVSASVSGVVWWKTPCSRARYACRPWPSSCASVSTSRRRAVQLSNRYGWCDGTVYAQNAPGRLPGRTGASIHDSSKNRCAASASSGENDAYASSTRSRRLAPAELVVGRRRPTPCGRSRRGGRGRAAAPSARTTAAGCRSGACTASTSACTDSSLASLARLRLAIQRRVVTQPVVDRLVGEQRVEHERTRAQARRERRR